MISKTKNCVNIIICKCLCHVSKMLASLAQATNQNATARASTGLGQLCYVYLLQVPPTKLRLECYVGPSLLCET